MCYFIICKLFGLFLCHFIICKLILTLYCFRFIISQFIQHTSVIFAEVKRGTTLLQHQFLKPKKFYKKKIHYFYQKQFFSWRFQSIYISWQDSSGTRSSHFLFGDNARNPEQAPLVYCCYLLPGPPSFCFT